MPNLILIRGLPGSGKSTLAKKIIQFRNSSEKIYKHLEADMFFVDLVTNQYNFDFGQLQSAHNWCQEIAEVYLKTNFNVIVSNTFTTKKELIPYFNIAKNYNIIPQVLLCQNNYNNIHNVPQEVMQKMRQRFEYDISDLF